jgi:hypothetical protein
LFPTHDEPAFCPPFPIVKEEKSRADEISDALAARCRVIFERLRPTLIETHYNWHIAIDPDTEQYLIEVCIGRLI